MQNEWLAEDIFQKRYFEAITEILNDDEKLFTFKRDHKYNSIVGMGDDWQFPFFSLYVHKTPEIHSSMEKIAHNDLFGGLKTFLYENIHVSVNTMRYAKTAAEIFNYFGTMNGKVVSEIGIGYGGLGYVMCSAFDIKSYHLLDLPLPQALAVKYLTKLGVKNISTEMPESSFLTVSEFALSELSLDQINEYYHKVLKKSENLYLMINIHDGIPNYTPDRKQTFLDILAQDFRIYRYDEYPKTVWPNDLIIANHL